MGTDATLRIKNLSIAFEAVSRIPGNDTIHWGIKDLLRHEIKEAKEENSQPKIPLPPTQPISTDDIPL